MRWGKGRSVARHQLWQCTGAPDGGVQVGHGLEEPRDRPYMGWHATARCYGSSRPSGAASGRPPARSPALLFLPLLHQTARRPALSYTRRGKKENDGALVPAHSKGASVPACPPAASPQRVHDLVQRGVVVGVHGVAAPAVVQQLDVGLQPSETGSTARAAGSDENRS